MRLSQPPALYDGGQPVLQPLLDAWPLLSLGAGPVDTPEKGLRLVASSAAAGASEGSREFLSGDRDCGGLVRWRPDLKI